METSLFFLATLCVACALPLALGLPLAARLGVGEGVGRLGFAAAIGMAIVLIACRAVQMWLPIGTAASWMLAGTGIVLTLLWVPSKIRRKTLRLLCVQRRAVVAFLGTGMMMVVLINVPILAGGALQFEGSRNADSFTFTSNARYMIGHAFFGAPDFSPSDPVYSISRSYFGEGATQPRPAAEGYLGWLSALSGKDPLYLYNALQAAGLLLAGLSVLTLVRQRRSGQAKASPWMLAIIVFACPALAYVGINSNFANNLNLAPATAYVALAVVRSNRVRMVLGVLFVASLLGGYPELLVFVVACRVLATLIQTIAEPTSCISKFASIGMELLLGCLAVPWAAKAAFIVYATTLGIGGSQDATLHGDMAEGLPLFGLALAAFAFCILQRPGKNLHCDGVGSLYAAVLAVFAAAQLAMVMKGFAYGGFRLAGYFVTLHLGVLAGSAAMALTQQSSHFMATIARRGLIAILIAMFLKTSFMMEKSWRIARQRQVSPELIALAQWLDSKSGEGDVLMGPMHQPFYHGMWLRYLTSAPLIYDFSRGEVAGYLSPYLKSIQQADDRSIGWIVTSESKFECSFECERLESFGRWSVWRAHSEI